MRYETCDGCISHMDEQKPWCNDCLKVDRACYLTLADGVCVSCAYGHSNNGGSYFGYPCGLCDSRTFSHYVRRGYEEPEIVHEAILVKYIMYLANENRMTIPMLLDKIDDVIQGGVFENYELPPEQEFWKPVGSASFFTDAAEWMESILRLYEESTIKASEKEMLQCVRTLIEQERNRHVASNTKIFGTHGS